MPNYFDEDMEWLNSWGNQKRTPKKTKVSSKTKPAASTSMADFRQIDQDSSKASAIANATKPAKKNNQGLASKIEESKPWQTIIGDYSVGEMLDAITMANPALTTAAGIKGLGGTAKAANKVTESAAAKALKSLATKAPTPVKKAAGIGAAATGYETVKGATDPDYVNPVTKQKTLPAQTGASLRAGTGDVLKNLGSVAEWRGKSSIGESLKKTGENISEGYETEQVPFTWRSLLDPDWYANNVARSVPSTATLIPLMVGGYKLGGAGAAKSGIKALSGPMGKTIIGSLTGTALSRPMESAMEAGNTYEDALAKGMSREEADEAAQQVFNANLKLAGLDAAQLATAFAPAPAKLAAKVGKAGMAAGKLGIEAGTEALEEGYQQAVQQQATGEDKRSVLEQIKSPNQEMQESMAIGGLFGLGMGGAGVVNEMVKNVKSRTIENLPDSVMPQVEERVQEHVSNGMTPAEAVDAVLDEAAGTPEVAQIISDITQEEAQKAIADMELSTENAEPEVNPEVNNESAINTVYHSKTGEPLKVVDDSNPEFMVVENGQGQRMAVTPDDITSELPKNIQTEPQPEIVPQAEPVNPVNAIQSPQDTLLAPETEKGLETKIEPQNEQAFEKQDAAKKEGPEAVPEQGTEPEKQKNPTPDRVLNIQRGKNGAVKVVFPDGNHADLFSFWGRVKRSIEGKKKYDTENETARLGHVFGMADGIEFGKAANSYRKAVMDAIKELPKGAKYEAPTFQEYLASTEQVGKPVAETSQNAELEHEAETTGPNQTDGSPKIEPEHNPEPQEPAAIKTSDTVYDHKGNALTVVNSGNTKTMRVEDREGKQKAIKKSEVKKGKPDSQVESKPDKSAAPKTDIAAGSKTLAGERVARADEKVITFPQKRTEDKAKLKAVKPKLDSEGSKNDVDQNDFGSENEFPERLTKGVNRQGLTEADQKRGLRTLRDEHKAVRAGYTGRSFTYQPEALEQEEIQLAADLAEAVGLKIFPFKYGNSKTQLINGMVQDGMMFINVQSDVPIESVALHEAVHQLREVAPDVYEQIEALIKSKIKDIEKLKAVYRQEYHIYPGDNMVLEEFTCDMIAEALSKEGAFFNPRKLNYMLNLRWQETYKEAGQIFRDFIDTDDRITDIRHQGVKFKRGEAEEYVPTFYSQLQRVIEQKMPNRADPEQIKGIVGKGAVKEEELKWSGLDDFLAERQGQKVTKQEVADYLKENDIRIQEVTPNKTKYENYQLPGGKNYRELLFTMPGERQYQSGHWDEPNVLAHARFNDRTGPNGEKILHVEEVQSDWHQEGRKKGYKGKAPSELQKRFDEAREKMNKEQTKYYGLREELGPNGSINEQKQIMLEAERAFEKIRDQEMSAYIFGVPDAPFKTIWPEFVMKRMIRYAAENGYDRISWTTGAQQAERYDLSKQVKFIGWQKYGNGKYNVTVKDPELNLIYNEREKTINDIEELAGKEIAKKIQSSAESSGVIEGDNLRIGGSGMSGFYDKMIPSWLNKYAKKWGSKVEESGISTKPNYQVKYDNNDGYFGIYDIQNKKWLKDHMYYASSDEAQRALDNMTNAITAVHSIPITESMRQSVLYEGQPKFKKAPEEIQIILDEASKELGWKKKWSPGAMKSERFQAANELSKALTGNEIITYTGLGPEQGFSLGGKVFLNARSKQPTIYIASHEITHTMEVNSPEHYDKLMDIVIEHVGDNSGIISHYLKQGYEKTEIPDELTADVLAECMVQPSFWQRVRNEAPELLKPILDIIDRILKVAKKQSQVPRKYQIMQHMKDVEMMRDRLARVYKDYLESIGETPAGMARDVAAKAKAGARNNNESPFLTPEYKEQIRKEKSAFISQIDNWKNGDIGFSDALAVGGTPKVLTRLGAENLPVFITQNTLHKLEDVHGFSVDMIKDLSDQIHDPVLVFDSSTKKGNAYVIVTEMMHKGSPVIVAFHLHKTVNGYLVNEIASSYEKRNSMSIFFNNWIAKEGLLRYQNTLKVGQKGWENKIKKSLDDWRLSRLQLPGGSQTSGSNHIVLTENDIVNMGNKPKLKRDGSGGRKFTLPNEEVQQRMENARGIKPDTLKTNIKEAWMEIYRKGHREYEWLPRTGRFIELRNALLKFRKQKGVAADKTLKIMDGVTKGLDEYEYDIFTYKVIFDDLSHDFNEDMLLPFGLNKDNFKENREYVDAEAIKNPKVMEAVEKRRKAWQNIKNDYIKAQKAVGFKVEDRLKKEDYYRHQVLEYANAKGLIGSGKKLRIPTGRGFLKQREGSSFDINTDYLQAEYEVMSQMIYDSEAAGVVKVVKDNYDIVDKLKKAAIEQNNEGILQYFKGLIDKYNISSTPEKLYRQMLNKKQAIAFGQLYKMAAKGELPFGPDEKYAEVVKKMAQAYWEAKAAKADYAELTEELLASDAQIPDEKQGQLFSYLNYLCNQTESEQGQIKARTVYTGIAEKQRRIKNTLGDRYVTWEDLIPEGYSLWQPRDGHMFYMATSIPEGIAEQLMIGIAEEANINRNTLRRVMVVGGNYPELVVPDEVALTLENLYKDLKETGLVPNFYHKLYRSWKQWQLISPRRYFKYNTRNVTGDIDAILAGNPSALKKVPKAWKDLQAAFFSKDKVFSPELYEWFKRGGFETLMQAQEINDINRNREFAHLMESRLKKTPIETLVNLPKTAWLKYWDAVRTTTDFREALLRYAAFLDYREQIRGNDAGKPANFGASNRGEIMGLKDLDDRAAKLANELLGAYDEVSVIGTALADNFLPFWRWNEVNFVRYCKLFKNAYQDGKLMAAIAGKVTGITIRSPFIAWKLGKFIVKASLLIGIITAWNNLYFDDEEKDLPADVRERLHIVLGRDKNGKVIYFSRLGAWQDFLDWFGLDTPVQTIRDFLNGRKTLKEIAIDVAKEDGNKIINAVTPFLKTPVELIGGQKYFPDAFKPQRIRDRWQYLAESFGLGNEYKALAGKPSRGYGDSLYDLFYYRADPYETAYWSTMDEKRRFLKKIGQGSEGYSTSPRSEALYNVKLALRYGDKEACKKYLIEYVAKGGTAQGLEKSLESMSPLNGLNDEEQIAFVKQLDTEGKEDFVKAMEYYARIISGESE